VLAFDSERQMRLCNPAAAQLLGLKPGEEGCRSATDLGLEALLSDSAQTQVITTIAGRTGRWQVTHGTFRESGLAQHLLIISDVQPALREEERAAWQRLIRVIGHEVNNSLAPIKSMAESLHGLLSDVLEQGKIRNDTLDALRVIGERTAGLGRFLAQYSRLARLPTARPRWQRLAPVLARIGALESLQGIAMDVSPDLEACIDADHLEQALINLGKNAVEATGHSTGKVAMSARARGSDLLITVTDDGPGVANPDNLFVPFFTTKPGGSGVGLVLSRQIVEAHGGSLQLANRADARGAVATLVLPDAARLRPEKS
jgi:two-component system, NtrC family, nitrogen regulation sensor histidine kinase NtrY